MTGPCPACGLPVTGGASCPLCGTLQVRPGIPRRLRKLLLYTLAVEEVLLGLLLLARG